MIHAGARRLRWILMLARGGVLDQHLVVDVLAALHGTLCVCVCVCVCVRMYICIYTHRESERASERARPIF